MDLGLRILHHPDRRPDLPDLVARQFAHAVTAAPPIAHSVATDGKRVYAAVSVRAFSDPLDGSTRYGVLVTGPDRQCVVADAPAKRHALKAYRQLVFFAHETYVPTAEAPCAWDYTDVSGIPSNLAAA